MILTFYKHFISLKHLISFVFAAVDKCAKCDTHARCDNGRCICNEGYVGDGMTCTKEGGPEGE